MASRVLAILDGALRIAGALVGAFPLAVLIAGAIAAHAPLPAEIAFPLGVLLVVPLWVAGMCAGFLARRGWHVVVAIAVATAALAWLVPHASLW